MHNTNILNPADILIECLQQLLLRLLEGADFVHDDNFAFIELQQQMNPHQLAQQKLGARKPPAAVQLAQTGRDQIERHLFNDIFDSALDLQRRAACLLPVSAAQNHLTDRISAYLGINANYGNSSDVRRLHRVMEGTAKLGGTMYRNNFVILFLQALV
ncbi:hypothetical protein D3C86_1587370 [compost metagenome]